MPRNKQPQIGDHVTLISSLEVRYEGVLFTIDPNESTVALQNVICLGTEDRQPPGEKAIPKSDTTYEFIIFRGVNIKSISCMDKGSKSPERPPINDPSILKVGQPTMRRTDRHHKNTNVSTRLQQRSFRGQRNNYQENRFQQQRSYDAPRGWQPTQSHDNRNYNQGRNRYHNQGPRNYRRGAGHRSNYRGRGNYRWQNRRNPDFAPGSGKFLTQADQAPVESTMKKDFNFEENNTRFDKDKYRVEAKQKDEAEAEKKVKEQEAREAELAEKAEAAEKEADTKDGEEAKKEDAGDEENKSDPTKNDKTAADDKNVGKKKETKRFAKPMAEALKMGTDCKYDPNNFFDELDDGRQPPEHADAQKRRAKDVSTFGEVAQTYSPKVFRRRKYRGRGGWRGRRGRGRYNYYRGRGRYYNYVQH